ncbi:MAG TPA: hypothetical protein VGH93_13475 [Solirubrobacteraceae bacterium]
MRLVDAGTAIRRRGRYTRAPLRPPAGAARRLLWNLRAGRMQRTLAATAAASALPLGFEMYLEHYKGSFGDAWMWSPIVTSPLLSAAGAAGARSQRAARTVLPVISAVYALNGAIGTITHIRGVQRKPGGFSEPTYNLVMGPPLLAPGSLILVGMVGVLAAIVERER